MVKLKQGSTTGPPIEGPRAEPQPDSTHARMRYTAVLASERRCESSVHPHRGRRLGCVSGQPTRSSWSARGRTGRLAAYVAGMRFGRSCPPSGRHWQLGCGNKTSKQKRAAEARFKPEIQKRGSCCLGRLLLACLLCRCACWNSDFRVASTSSLSALLFLTSPRPVLDLPPETRSSHNQHKTRPTPRAPVGQRGEEIPRCTAHASAVQ